VQLTPLSTRWAPRKNIKKGTIFFGHPGLLVFQTPDAIKSTLFPVPYSFLLLLEILKILNILKKFTFGSRDN
jgi:hypothetical protein